MYRVYWTEFAAGTRAAHARDFDSHEMSAAMQFMEQLRMRQRAGEDIRFVALASENPNAVGPSGVADPADDYNWKKRRR